MTAGRSSNAIQMATLSQIPQSSLQGVSPTYQALCINKDSNLDSLQLLVPNLANQVRVV